MVKDDTGTPFCLCGFQPPGAAGIWQAKHDVLNHIADERNLQVPEFAENVTIDLQRKKLLINGTEFPWFISADGIDVQDLMTENCLPSFILRIPAGTIQVIPEEGRG